MNPAFAFAFALAFLSGCCVSVVHHRHGFVRAPHHNNDSNKVTCVMKV